LEDQKPIIVRKIKRHGKHHGGAWKVAFADFATAMMAFFLVLWLSASTTPEQKKALEGYFKDPVGFVKGGSTTPIDLGGSPAVVNITIQETNDKKSAKNDANNIVLKDKQVEQMAESLEQKKLQKVMKALQEKIEKNKILKEYKSQIKLDITKEGLRIQIVDAEKRPMFDSGSAELKLYSADILSELATTLAELPNKISITGHTDSQKYVGRPDYSNWELSADRANAARRALTEAGEPGDQIARVVGLASSVPYDKTHPDAPVNRRISILVLNKKAEQAIEQSAGKVDQKTVILPDINLKGLGLPSNIKEIGSIKRIPAKSKENQSKASNRKEGAVSIPESKVPNAGTKNSQPKKEGTKSFFGEPENKKDGGLSW
jgi:chemotaxis protein MotB